MLVAHVEPLFFLAIKMWSALDFGAAVELVFVKKLSDAIMSSAAPNRLTIFPHLYTALHHAVYRITAGRSQVAVCIPSHIAGACCLNSLMPERFSDSQVVHHVFHLDCIYLCVSQFVSVGQQFVAGRLPEQ